MLHRYLFVALLLCVPCNPAALAQTRLSNVSIAAQDLLEIARPRIAPAPDGSFAIAFEALVQHGSGQDWEIAVQRFLSTGAAVGEMNFFVPRSCTFSWTSDYLEHPDVEYRSDGILVVAMQHAGEYFVAGDPTRSSEVRLGAIGPDGQILDISPSVASCEEREVAFVGGGRQDRPRLALTPNGEVMLTADGFFDGSSFRNVAIKIYDNQLGVVFEQLIPHDDPASQQSFHMQPDIATNGSLILSVWQECPMIDQQGNAAECDIAGQFAQISSGQILPLGGNTPVNSGDPPGTASVLPAAAINAGGRSVVAWVDSRTGPQTDIFAQVYNSSGEPQGGNVQVSTGEGVIYTRPEVAMLTDGSFAVVWTDSSSAGFRARSRHYDVNGDPTGTPQVLGESTETGQPHVASDGSAYYYTWLGRQNGGPLELFYSAGAGVVASEPDHAPEREISLAAFPNPFSSSARIRYVLRDGGPVTLTVHDVLGREVARLVDGFRAGGEHEARLSGSALPAGPYLVILRQGALRQAQMVFRR